MDEQINEKADHNVDKLFDMFSDDCSAELPDDVKEGVNVQAGIAAIIRQHLPQVSDLDTSK